MIAGLRVTICQRETKEFETQRHRGNREKCDGGNRDRRFRSHTSKMVSIVLPVFLCYRCALCFNSLSQICLFGCGRRPRCVLSALCVSNSSALSKVSAIDRSLAELRPWHPNVKKGIGPPSLTPSLTLRISFGLVWSLLQGKAFAGNNRHRLGSIISDSAETAANFE